MAFPQPFASHEIRWFFEGKTDQHDALKRWFETATPVPKDPGLGPPEWRGRLEGRPDVYLIVPGSNDMGIKWREGLMQIKGRVSSLGRHLFCGRHEGEIERWMKWSYADMPAAYERLFIAGRDAEMVTVSVTKTRALRKVRLDPVTGEMREIAVETIVDRGLGFEMTDLEVDGIAWCSLACEAFPSDDAMDAEFIQVVETVLEGLTEIDLSAKQSQSYPAFLDRVIRN